MLHILELKECIDIQYNQQMHTYKMIYHILLITNMFVKLP
jgi:hypothetical protein